MGVSRGSPAGQRWDSHGLSSRVLDPWESLRPSALPRQAREPMAFRMGWLQLAYVFR